MISLVLLNIFYLYAAVNETFLDLEEFQFKQIPF